MPLVSNKINNFFDVSSLNSIKEIKNLQTEMSKLLKTSRSVVSEINKIGNEKIKIKIDTKGIDKNVNHISKKFASLGKDIEKNVKEINSSVSKMDNDISSREEKPKKDNEEAKKTIISYTNKLASDILPSNASSAISAAISGAQIGSLFGTIGSIVGAALAAGVDLVMSEVKKTIEKKQQYISIASNIATTNLPKIAMESVNYASNMDKSRTDYKNILGKDKGNSFVDNMLERSNKDFYDYSDMDSSGKQMLAAGFGRDQTLRIFDAVGNSSAGNGRGKEEALRMMDALKSMKTSGKVTFDNLDVFKNIGVDAYGILADSIEIAGKNTKATKEELNDLISRGVIPADNAIKYLISGLEKEYIGMMHTQNQTFGGLISTIKDSANQIILGPLGTGFIEGIKPALTSFASFFGLGTDGFKKLKDEIYNFSFEIGELAGGAINTLRNTFDEFFNNEDFQNASLPDKIMMVFDEVKKKADEWCEGGGKEMMDSIAGFFTDFFIELSRDSAFLDAVQGLWMAIAPDGDTMKNIILKATNLDFLEGISNFISNAGSSIGSFIGAFFNGGNESKTMYYRPISNGTSSENFSLNAIGLNRVPYDYYPALLHEGEAVLRRTEADNYRKGIGAGTAVTIGKIADTVVVKNEADMYKIADILVSEIEKAGLVYGGAM